MADWSVDQWRSIRLSSNDLEQLHPLLSLVGSYARHIVLVQPSEKSIIKVIDSLIHMGFTCLSTFMVAIDNKCDLVPSTTFSTFAQYMTRLHIGSTRSQCDILGILACCPQLTHFSSSARVHVSPKTANKASSLSCFNLQFLRLNHGISTEQLLDIMRASPNMRHLRLQWHSNIDLIQIVKARPELDIITCNVFPSLGQDPLWSTNYETPCNHLRTFEIDNVLHETPLHHLMAILNTSWGEGLERLSCGIGKIYGSKDTMRKMPPILTPPDTCQLQEFIYNSQKSHNEEIDDPEETIILPILSRCKQLHTIAIDMDTCHESRGWMNSQEVPDLTPFNHLPHLRHLSIHENRSDLSDLSFMFLQMRHYGVQLESFEYQMNQVDTALEFVGALITIPTMRHLILKEAYPKRLMPQGLFTLARCLSQSSPIVSLTLKGCPIMEYKQTFEILCDMTDIKHLTLSNTRWLNVSGLMHLADHHTSLDTLELVNVTLNGDGIQTQDTIEYLESRISNVIVNSQLKEESE
ncbi:hypothetical protein O0I10_010038 [Lichtheimia ornata]|uniref:Uncharacterized protein n=1 Tax=Lichtheimia ornata TaxID=688661 RepID=A0AAD7UVW2_9FUNG|nr:uncharacterized protein O0I10_010038 [Lichtheimia ornata]KAJ8654342.1 hypothetical protein O0I10_010038 [Lichtheimia ornata]